MRKAVSISTADDGSFQVLCEDGSVWTFTKSEGWQEVAPPLPPIPPRTARVL